MSYPVLHFDMSMEASTWRKTSWKDISTSILEEQEEKWGITDPAVDANDRLKLTYRLPIGKQASKWYY